MFIGALLDVPLNDEEAFQTFLGVHDLLHGTIMQSMQDAGFQTGIRYPLFGDPRQDANWFLDHYTMHQVINEVLGIGAPPDLADSDFEDQDQWNDWQQSHALEHEKIMMALNLN